MLKRFKVASELTSIALFSLSLAPIAAQAAGECAAYQNDTGQTIEGAFDGKDCTYSTTFSDAGNNLASVLAFNTHFI